MSLKTDPRVDLARARPLADAVSMLTLEGLRKFGAELVGPCPDCGGDDRFSLNPQKGVWRCRICSPRGGDAIALVQLAMGLDFMGAVGFLEGEPGVEIDPKEVERREKARAADKAKNEAESARYREFARRDAVAIWTSARTIAGTVAEAYLEGRVPGLTALGLPFRCFRFLPDHPYIKTIARQRLELHRGPALISAVQGRDGRLSAVHQTWVDLDAPKGKARIAGPDGKPLKAKLVRGSKKGGAIRLTGTACTSSLVMGEGIETTGTALAAAAVRGASYWAGVDLGNMGGMQTARHSGVPDLSDGDAFVPPACVDRLIYIQDGDSAEIPTRATLTSGLRRAMSFNPDLRGHIVRAGDGVDLNDLI